MPLPDGEHWFHVRAVDTQGNWGQAVHVGPIRIDTFQPVRPVPSSPSHRVGGVSADRTIDVAWSGASDAQSGLDGYAVSWTLGRAGTPPDGQEPRGDRLARHEPAARRRRVVVQHPGGRQRWELERRGQRRPVLDPRRADGLLRPAAARPEARRCEAITREAGLLARPGLHVSVRGVSRAAGWSHSGPRRASGWPGALASGSFSAAVAAKTARVW